MPFWILYLISKYMIFRYNFGANLKSHGIDKATSKLLVKELNILPSISFLKGRLSSSK